MNVAFSIAYELPQEIESLIRNGLMARSFLSSLYTTEMYKDCRIESVNYFKNLRLNLTQPCHPR